MFFLILVGKIFAHELPGSSGRDSGWKVNFMPDPYESQVFLLESVNLYCEVNGFFMVSSFNPCHIPCFFLCVRGCLRAHVFWGL